MSTRIDTLIVGAGHAGLAVSYHLLLPVMSTSCSSVGGSASAGTSAGTR